jgi:hypothetical protein
MAVGIISYQLKVIDRAVQLRSFHHCADVDGSELMRDAYRES